MSEVGEFRDDFVAVVLVGTVVAVIAAVAAGLDGDAGATSTIELNQVVASVHIQMKIDSLRDPRF